jgi:hypothetical protein
MFVRFSGSVAFREENFTLARISFLLVLRLNDVDILPLSECVLPDTCDLVLFLIFS